MISDLYDLMGAAVLLWSGITVLRLAKRYAAADVPPPLNIEVTEYRRERRTRDRFAATGAGVGALLLLAGATRILFW